MMMVVPESARHCASSAFGVSGISFLMPMSLPSTSRGRRGKQWGLPFSPKVCAPSVNRESVGFRLLHLAFLSSFFQQKRAMKV